jgi:glycosyltransferase involved in cell wall biosynthesis
MRIAFYAPLKPLDHKVPSGDRRVAGLFLEALRLAGHQPFIASRLRSFDAFGDAARQALLAERGRETAARLVAGWRRQPQAAPGLWVTYHLYYKAPDWIGPEVCAGLGIPYVVAEASLAMKRAAGPWAPGHRAVAAALRRADRVIGVNSADREGVLPLLAHRDRWLAVPPFIDARNYAGTRHKPGAPSRLVTVAMMRPGDKLASYRVLGTALSRLLDLAWTLEVIGDGPARADVETALAPLAARVRYAGALSAAVIAARLRETDLFVWPAINEAYGMALLEAQAAGLAVVAGDSGGVGDVIADGVTGLLTSPGDVAAFAASVRGLVSDPARCATLGGAGREKIRRDHDLPHAAARLSAMIAMLMQARAA